MQKTKELRALDERELQEEYRNTVEEIFHFSNELAAFRKLDKPHLLRKSKRYRARILTLFRERKDCNKMEKND